MTSNSINHNFKIDKTKKGFRIANVTIPNYPIATTSVWINAGSSKDPLKKLGLSHFFEHLLFTKTQKFPDRQKRLEEVEKNGLTYNAFTTVQNQHYFYVHSPEKSGLALELLIDGLTNSIFREEDVEREKETILSEETENRNSSSDYIWRIANKGLWGGEKLGKDFYGSKETISSITKADIDSFYRSHFHSANFLFVFINSSQSFEEQEEVIDSCKFGIDGAQASTENYQRVSSPLVFESMDIDNVQLTLSFLTISILEEREKIVQDFVGKYLSNEWTSRLIRRLRVEENLTYWVTPDLCTLESSGYMRFSLSTDKKNVNRVLEIFKEEIKALKRDLVSPEIVANHETKLISDTLRDSVDYSWLMHWYGYTSLLKGKQLTVTEYCQAIDLITPKEIQEFAEKYLTSDRFSLAYIAREKLDIPIITFQ